jgi:hypothetical protein
MQTMNQSNFIPIILAWVVLTDPATTMQPDRQAARADGGKLTLVTRDEAAGSGVPARLELRAEKGRPPTIRKAQRSGEGVVIDREIELSLREGNYRFRVLRGPEYRVVEGNFEVQPGATDTRIVDLVRMVDMRSEGFLSGDLAWPGTLDEKLPTLMAAEDLHVAAVVAETSSPADAKDSRTKSVGQTVVPDGDWLTYPGSDPQSDSRLAVANPFAWELPIWLATKRIDGFFVLGDWLRDGPAIEKFREGRPPAEIGFTGNDGPGRYAETVYWRMLEAGFRIPPLAGTITNGGDHVIGYNRVYGIGPSLGTQDDRRAEPITDEGAFYRAVWEGRSVVTNGPLLRPTLGGYAPGHVFQASPGEALKLMPELHLAVRDPVDYLEVIHNGKRVHSVRLDEYAKAGGTIPELTFRESGWVMIHVVTQHEGHFRAALSAPWYIEFAGAPRVSREAVEFFRQWLSDCEQKLKQLPSDRLTPYIEPVRAARAFWEQKLDLSGPN